jgi:hypothetical protein
MAMPQTGQWRMGGRWRELIEKALPEYPHVAVDPDQCGFQPLWLVRRTGDSVFLARSDLGQSAPCRCAQSGRMWSPISSAPFARDLELAVIDADGPHALVFPCRRILNGWMNADTKERLDVRPTHWREWAVAASA